MKKSELRQMIKEEISNVLLKETIAADDTKAANSIKKNLYKEIDNIAAAFDLIKKKLSDFNSPGLTHSFARAIQEGRAHPAGRGPYGPHPGKTGFDIKAAKAELDRYFKDI